MNTLSKDELMKISECIIKTMDGMVEAGKKITGKDASGEVQKEIQRLVALNSKVCSLADSAEN